MQLPTRILTLLLANAVLTSASAQTLPSTPPSPAAAAPVIMDPLLVTGDLWASPLERIPASVTVLDNETLRVGAVRHFADLADRIPNLTWSGGTSRPRYFQIRGVGENSQYEGETPDSTVRFLIDDLDFTGLGTVGGTFDLSQVEVLRGPQAGAFGANAAGGVIRLVTNAPTPFWTGRLEGTAGGDSLRAGGFAIGGPLVAANPEQFMMRLAVHHHVSDGFRRNVTLNRDTNARDEFNTRLRLTWNPGPDWRWEGTVLFSRVDNGFDEFALDNNGRLTYSDQPGRDEQDSTATSLRGSFMGWQGIRFTTVTSAAWVDSVYSYDDDWTAASYMGFSDLQRDRTVFNQEVRLDSTATRNALGVIDRWTLGTYFSRLSEDGAYTNEDPGNIRGLDTRYESRNLALFGQATGDLSDRTRLIVGLRAERLDLEGSGLRTRFRKGPGTFDPEARVAPHFDDTFVGGKLTIEHDLTPRHLVFASVTRGYKGGGINVDARIDPSTDPLTYDTETLWNYEIGIRGHAYDQRLIGELTAFRIDRHDAQVRDSAGFGGSYRFFTANANRARIHGLEASAGWTLTEHWSLHGSFALMDSHLDSFILSGGGTAGDRHLANTPRHGYNLSIRYGNDAGFFGNLELTGRARQYDSNNHDEPRGAFNVINGTLGYAWRDWTVTLWARNLFNEKYENRVFYFGNEDPDYNPARYETRAAPRQIGVTAAYRF